MRESVDMLCNREKCLGCYACANTCKKQAIDFWEDETGAVYPNINTEKCVHCGRCVKNCPILYMPNGNEPIRCYAAWSTNAEIQKNAASGGIVSTIYYDFLNKGGTIFGAKYIKSTLYISEANSIDSVKYFSGSKYIHAYVGTTFIRVRELLKEGKMVVFVGTPCQIAGLRSFLKKEYDNLLLVDIVCHGVSPQKCLKEYVKEKCHLKYENAIFRGKEGNSLAVYAGGKLVYCREKWFDSYSMAYAKGLISRENCYSCPFATYRRQGDITVGDFWGLDKTKLHVDASKIPFVSLVLVNTEKGKKAFEDVKDYLICEERDIREALVGNRQLTTPCERNNERETFLNNERQMGFFMALKKTQLYKDTQRIYRIKILKTPFRFLKRMKNGGK
jgi:coenzyme F420-reducing hydrogenase beta subunit